MAALNLIVNAVFGTSFGHLQLVLDTDGIFGNGDELEIQVVSPNFLGIGDWKVDPVQPLDLAGASARVTLDIDDPLATWDLLVRARNAFAADPPAYEAGIFGIEGQNSNSYIVTLSHIADIDISTAVPTLLAAGVVSSLPGVARNVLFDQIDGDGFDILPYDLTLTGTAAGEVIRGGAGWDTINGGKGDDVIAGYGGKDWLSGAAGWDDIYGDAGADRLKGGGGSDLLVGGDGRDRISGDKGNDILTGGAGLDTFLFNGLVFQGRDSITDFQLDIDVIRVLGLTFADVDITGTTDAVITLGGLTEITLGGVAADDILAQDFIFV